MTQVVPSDRARSTRATLEHRPRTRPRRPALTIHAGGKVEKRGPLATSTNRVRSCSLSAWLGTGPLPSDLIVIDALLAFPPPLLLFSDADAVSRADGKSLR